MPQPTPARVRRCPDCDGFPTVHITTGAHHHDGTRATLAVTCSACRGTGTAPLKKRATAAVSGWDTDHDRAHAKEGCR